MINIFDSGWFNVAKYTDPNKSEEDLQPVEAAKKWAEESNLTIIIPTGDLQKLEELWEKYNSMSHDNRRRSDWECIELFGCTNKDLYDRLKSFYCNEDIPSDIELGRYDLSAHENEPLIGDDGIALSEGSISDFDLDDIADYYDQDSSIQYTSEDIDKAIKYACDSGRIIIYPTRTLSELEDLWDAYNAMTKKHRRESDWMSEEFFGVTNLKHYEFLKRGFLRDDISEDDKAKYGSLVENTNLVPSRTSSYKKYFISECGNMSASELAKSLLSITEGYEPYSEEILIKQAITDVIDKYNDIMTVTDIDLPEYPLPFLTPQEMIDAGVFGATPDMNCFGTEPISNIFDEDNGLTVREWFDMYKAQFNGFHTEMAEYSDKWRTKVSEYMNMLKMNPSNSIKQAILELGWNPSIPFNPSTQRFATDKINSFIECNVSPQPTKFYDISDFEIPSNMKDKLVEASIENELKPIFIVLSEGKSAFSSAIKSITKTIYSHASIAFDAALDKMYSFGIQGAKKKIAGGFIEEDIKTNNDPNKRVDVFVFFVPENILNQLKVKVKEFEDNVYKTSYSYKNLFTYIFNIPCNNDWTMICSQFVDRMLKAVGIDITKKDSSLVSPKDIDNSAKNNRNIYRIYSGKAGKYNGEKASATVKCLVNKARPLAEENVFYRYNPNEYIANIIYNAGNPVVLRDMRGYKSIVENASQQNILNMLFECIDVRSYCEFDEDPNCVSPNGSGRNVNNTSRLINKYMTHM